MFNADSFIALFQLKSVRIALVVTGAIILTIMFVVPFGMSFTPENQEKAELKEKIVQKIGIDNFEVKEVVARVDTWTYAKIAIKDENSDNESFVIFKEEGGKQVLKFGPGTSFSREQMEKAGVPVAIYNPEPAVTVDPIIKLLPYYTDNFRLTTSSSHGSGDGTTADETPTVGNPESKKVLTVHMYEFPRSGIKVTQIRMDQARANITQWMQSSGLNPDNYDLSFAIWASGSY